MTRVYLLAIIALLLLGVVLWYQHATDYRPRPLTTTRPASQCFGCRTVANDRGPVMYTRDVHGEHE